MTDWLATVPDWLFWPSFVVAAPTVALGVVSALRWAAETPERDQGG